jgi:molybdate transport system ATP-binding protein
MVSLHVDLSHRLRAIALDLTFEVEPGTLALVGPSGAGKTTALRTVAGLLRPDRGRITFGAETWLDTERSIDLPPERRSVGFAFQEYALFPHLSVRENVAYGARDGVDELLERLGIGQLARERPAGLSGGERQRVALARALARRPDVLLLDEPLSALDAHTRVGLRAELRELLSERTAPTVLVTHDFEEAAAMAERVGVVVEGRLFQLGTPAELVAAPADAFVAGFTGANVLLGEATPAREGLTAIELDSGGTVYSSDEGRGRVAVVVHPWEISVAHESPSDSTVNHVHAPIRSIVPLGHRVRVRVGPVTAELTSASLERLDLRPGQLAVASFKATGTRLLPVSRLRA